MHFSDYNWSSLPINALHSMAVSPGVQNLEENDFLATDMRMEIKSLVSLDKYDGSRFPALNKKDAQSGWQKTEDLAAHVKGGEEGLQMEVGEEKAEVAQSEEGEVADVKMSKKMMKIMEHQMKLFRKRRAGGGDTAQTTAEEEDASSNFFKLFEKFEEQFSAGESARKLFGQPDNFLGFSDAELRLIRDDLTHTLPRFADFIFHTETLNKLEIYSDMREKMKRVVELPDYLPGLVYDRAILQQAQDTLDNYVANCAKMDTKIPVIDGFDLNMLKVGGETVTVGAGAWGIAVRAQHAETKEQLVVKFIHCSDDTTSTHDELLACLVKEVQLQGHFSTQTDLAPKVHGVAVVKDEQSRYFKFAIVQEYINCIPGQNFSLPLARAVALHKGLVLNKGSLLPKSEWIKIFLKLVQMKQALVNEKIVHFDAKFNNILLQMRDGEIVPIIIDFGLALYNTTSVKDLPFTLCDMEERDKKHPHIPVEAVAEGRVGPKSDLYTLGYELQKMALIMKSKPLLALCGGLMVRYPVLRVGHGYAEKKLEEMLNRRVKKEKPSRFKVWMKKMFKCCFP